MQRPEAGKPIRWLTGRVCAECDAWTWCILTIAEGHLESIWRSAYTREILHSVHAVSVEGLRIETRWRGLPDSALQAILDIDVSSTPESP